MVARLRAPSWSQSLRVALLSGVTWFPCMFCPMRGKVGPVLTSWFTRLVHWFDDVEGTDLFTDPDAR